jgi:hypothetical protein
MTQIAAKGYRVDFLPIHTYSGLCTNPAALAARVASYATDIHNRYKCTGGVPCPIWVTEMGCIDFSKNPSNPTDANVEAFMSDVVKALESVPFIERFAWYRIGPGDIAMDGWLNIALSNLDGSPTAIGTYYSSLY